MARFKGTFEVPANYEPQKAAPFDARQLVESKSDLFLARTWQDTNGDMWIYTGMIVSVATDIEASYNGVYRLVDAAKYDQETGWQKLADDEAIAAIQEEIKDLQEQIENIEVSGGGSSDIEVETEADLPEVGDENTTYYVKENSSIQRWDAEEGNYDIYGGAADLNINFINGGNANGND